MMSDTAELVRLEHKLRAILLQMIPKLEADVDRPWEVYQAAKKRDLRERQIKRFKKYLQELEFLATWTAGGDGASQHHHELAARRTFMAKHYHFIECPFPPYPTSDDSSSDEEPPRRVRHTSR